MLISTDILHRVVQGTNQSTGEEFFDSLTRSLAEALGVSYCFLTRCTPNDPPSLQTLSFFADGNQAPNFEYATLNTPCEHVLSGRSCIFGSNIQELFPDDPDLVTLEAESYAAAPLLGSGGDVIGHLAVLDRRAMNESRPPLPLLELFAARAVAEMERRRATEDLARNEARLRSVVEGTADKVGEAFFQSLVRHLAEAFRTDFAVLAEIDGDQVHSRAVWAKGAFLDPVAYPLAGSPCEDVAKGHSRFFPARLQQLFPDHIVPAHLDAESYIGTPVHDAEGRVVGLLAVLDQSPITDDSQFLPLMRIFAARAGAEIQRRRLERDQQKLQEQVLHVQKLESLGVLAGGIAHDFNNLLCAIQGNVDLAVIHLDKGDAVAVQRHLLESNRAVRHCAELTHQMLAYSGHGSFVVDRFDLSELVKDMLDLLSVSISKKVRLHLDLGQDLPPCEGDATQIRQVVMNLVINASDAIGGRPGAVHLETGVAELDPSDLPRAHAADDIEPGPFLYLKIRDDGSGMDDATLHRLFDPFFTTKETGRGLGLAALLGIVRGHGGAVQVKTRPGEGSTFMIHLPTGSRRPASKPVERAVLEPTWRGSGKALVVDDEPLVRTVTAEMMEMLGFEVVTAENGRQALEAFQNDPDGFRMVLLDVMMPELDGVETLRELRKLRPSVKVVMASGFSKQSISIEDGSADGFLHKPVRLEELQAALQPLL